MRCRYAEMYDMFALIDGGGAGVSKDDDRKIQLEELVAGIEEVNHLDFVALKGKTAADAELLFKEMDDDGAGEVLLVEWCEYLKKKEIEAGTEMGALLSLGDEQNVIDAQKRKARKKAGKGKTPKKRVSKAEQEAQEAAASMLQKFKAVFAPLAEQSEEAKKLRKAAWRQMDANGNGLVSLSELDRCIQNMLFGKYGPEGKQIWRYFRPSYIRAFKDAADIGEDDAVTANSSKDDFVEPGEFRPCCAYLCM